MANVLGSLFVELKANTASFVEGMSRAAYVGKQAGKDIEKSFGSLGEVARTALEPLGPIAQEIGQILGTIGEQAGRAVSGFAKMDGILGAVSVSATATIGVLAAVDAGAIALSLHTIESAANLHDQAQAAGVTTEALSGLSFVARQAGVDQQTLTSGLEKMAKAASAAASAPEGARNAFSRLGVELKNTDGSLRDSEAVFTDLAERFSQLPNGIQKTALAIEIFGKAGAGMIPVLNEGREGVQKWLETAQKWGAVVSGDVARGAKQFEDNIERIKIAAEGMAQQLTTRLLPAFSAVADALVNSLNTNRAVFTLVIDAVAWLVKGTVALADEFGYLAEQTVNAFKVMKAAIDPFTSSLGDALLQMRQARAEHSKFLTELFAPSGTGSFVPFDTSKPHGPRGEAIGSVDSAGTDKAAESQKKLAAAIASVTAEFTKQLATVGASSDRIKVWDLAQQGATHSTIMAVEKLRLYGDLTEQSANHVKQMADAAKEAQKSGLDSKIAEEGAAIENSFREAGAAAFDLDTAWQEMGSSGPQAFHGVDAAVDELNKKLREEIDTFGMSQEQGELWRLRQSGATNEQIAGLEQLDAQLEKMRAGAENAQRTWKRFGDQVSRDFARMIVDGEKFSDVLKSILRDVVELLLKQTLFGGSGGGGGGFFGSLISHIAGIFGGGGLGGVLGDVGGSIPTDVFSGGTGIIFAANGANVGAGQPMIVGERGPEFFVPRTAGSVIPNGGAGGVAVTYNIDARGADIGVEQRIRAALDDVHDRSVNDAFNLVQQHALRTA